MFFSTLSRGIQYNNHESKDVQAYILVVEEENAQGVNGIEVQRSFRSHGDR